MFSVHRAENALFPHWKKSCDQPRQHIKKQRHYFTNKGPSSQSYGFSSSHVWMWELGHKENWVPNNWCWCFWTVVLETLESTLDSKEIKPVNPKGNPLWLFMGRTDAEVKLQYFGHLMWRTNSLGKTLMLERLKAGGERGNRGWDVWMASPTWWTWVWTSSGSWWWTRKPGMLQSMGSQRVVQDWGLSNWTELTLY